MNKVNNCQLKPQAYYDLDIYIIEDTNINQI